MDRRVNLPPKERKSVRTERCWNKGTACRSKTTQSQTGYMPNSSFHVRHNAATFFQNKHSFLFSLLDLTMATATMPTHTENYTDYDGDGFSRNGSGFPGHSSDNDDNSLFFVPPGLVVLLSFLYGSISAVTVVGNFLVILVILKNKSMQTVTNFYIANLAVADVIVGIFAIPFQFQAALLQRWDLPEVSFLGLFIHVSFELRKDVVRNGHYFPFDVWLFFLIASQPQNSRFVLFDTILLWKKN